MALFRERVGPIGPKRRGKVERPFRYIREDFFLARTFRNLDDLNDQLDDWLATVANVRLHGTTQRIVAEAFAAEKAELHSLPAVPFDELLRLERRVSHDDLVSIGGNYYSVPDRTRRVVEVHQLPDQIRILDQARLVATHPVLEGRRQYRIDPAHRHASHTRMPRQRPKTSSSAESVNVSPIVRLRSIRPSANDLRSREVGHDRPCRCHYHRQRQK
jgi:hypothetical protein